MSDDQNSRDDSTLTQKVPTTEEFQKVIELIRKWEKKFKPVVWVENCTSGNSGWKGPGWYFFDETGGLWGPYDSPVKAREECSKYNPNLGCIVSDKAHKKE